MPLIMYVLALLVLIFDPNNNVVDPSNACLGWVFVGVSFLGLLIRFWVIGYVPKSTSGRNTHKQVADEVNSKGIYSLVRHPLYLGNFFMWLGIILYVGNIWFTIVSCLLYWIYYERIMYAEEMFMRNKFGKGYTNWADTVPAFFPKFSGYVSAGVGFSWKNVLKREYSGFLAIFVSFLLLNFLKHYFTKGEAYADEVWIYAFLGALVVTLILRTLKKTGKLEVEGR